jgi:DNA-binding transcriptional regulator YdaS (Cro superfamily)
MSNVAVQDDQMRKRSEGLQRAIAAAGGIRKLARLLKIQHNSVMQWKDVPTHRILQIETVTKIPREKLRPDLYERKPRQR